MHFESSWFNFILKLRFFDKSKFIVISFSEKVRFLTHCSQNLHQKKKNVVKYLFHLENILSCRTFQRVCVFDLSIIQNLFVHLLDRFESSTFFHWSITSRVLTLIEIRSTEILSSTLSILSIFVVFLSLKKFIVQICLTSSTNNVKK